jgi:hypothetical protein
MPPQSNTISPGTLVSGEGGYCPVIIGSHHNKMDECKKQRRHHVRVERRLAEPARVAAGDLAQIEVSLTTETISRDRWSSAT